MKVKTPPTEVATEQVPRSSGDFIELKDVWLNGSKYESIIININNIEYCYYTQASNKREYYVSVVANGYKFTTKFSSKVKQKEYYKVLFDILQMKSSW